MQSGESSAVGTDDSKAKLFATSILAGINPQSIGVSDPIEAKEHLADLRRAWYGVLAAGTIYPLFGLFDLLQTRFVGTGELARLLAFRAIPWPFVIAMGIRLRRKPPLTRRAFDIGMTICMMSISLSLSLMCIETGGLTSIYAAGVLLAVVGVFFTSAPFSRSARLIFCTLVVYPITMYGSALFVPKMAEQLHDTRALAISAQFHFVGFGIGAFVASVNHFLWSMRRELIRTRSVGRYRLNKLVARGGMGEIWTAHHEGLRRDVAVKILRLGGEESSEVAARRFELEVQTTADLTHPNTVRVFDYGVTDDGLLYYAMEYLEGETLGRLVKREGALPPDRVVHFLRQAARALAEAHGRGIVHRDIKPENLFITTVGGEGDFLKILDFGIAKIKDNEAQARLTATGAVAGTPIAMSPEVIRGAEATPASDVYALGTVAYFALTATLPFTTSTTAATLLAHVSAPVVPPSERCSTPISPELEALVMRCLEKDPADRFSDAKALVEALDSLAEAGRHRPAVDAAGASKQEDSSVRKVVVEEPLTPTRTSRRSQS